LQIHTLQVKLGLLLLADSVLQLGQFLAVADLLLLNREERNEQEGQGEPDNKADAKGDEGPVTQLQDGKAEVGCDDGSNHEDNETNEVNGPWNIKFSDFVNLFEVV